jgi:hypothetical protein
MKDKLMRFWRSVAIVTLQDFPIETDLSIYISNETD